MPLPIFDPALDAQEGDSGLLVLPRLSQTPALFDEVRVGLGASDMSLGEMVLEMRRIRRSSEYEGEA